MFAILFYTALTTQISISKTSEIPLIGDSSISNSYQIIKIESPDWNIEQGNANMMSCANQYFVQTKNVDTPATSSLCSEGSGGFNERLLIILC